MNQAYALDRITLRGVRGFGYHGCFEHERREGQEFGVDVSLGVLSITKAAKTDDLKDTADYGAIALAIVGIIEGEPVNLIERLASLIAARCLEFDFVRSAEVTVHKPSAPITVPFDDVAVTVTRVR